MAVTTAQDDFVVVVVVFGTAGFWPLVALGLLVAGLRADVADFADGGACRDAIREVLLVVAVVCLMPPGNFAGGVGSRWGQPFGAVPDFQPGVPAIQQSGQ